MRQREEDERDRHISENELTLSSYHGAYTFVATLC